MKKLLLTFSLLVIGILTYSQASARTYKSGAFSYHYKVEKGNVWITKIDFVSNKGLGTLNIPSRIKGKKVVAIGPSKEDFEDGDNHKENIFGVFENPEVDFFELVPSDLHNKVGKIKKIVLPSTLKQISMNCFSNVQDGKIINIPKNVTKYVVGQFTQAKWKKITISPKNPKLKVKNGCLLSKNGKEVYGIVQKRKKIYIPDTVNVIDTGILEDGVADGDYNGADTIIIPQSVKLIRGSSLNTRKPVTIKIDKGNKRYAVKDGSVYSKKTGRLVAGYVKNGVLSIPNTVFKITEPGYLGGMYIKKIIVPSSVKKMESIFLSPEQITFVFKGATPPKLTSEELMSFSTKIVVYVPKKYKSVYDKWLANSEDYGKKEVRTI